MKSEDAPPKIPIPWSVRWRLARIRILPVAVFGTVVVSIGYLWKDHVASPMMVGQAEPVLANVSCYKPGVLADLTVNRFQPVKAGETVGRVLVTDPGVLASSLAVIQAEIELLRSGA